MMDDFVSRILNPSLVALPRSINVYGQPLSIINAVRRPSIIVLANKWFPKRRFRGDPPNPCRSKKVFSAAGAASVVLRVAPAAKRSAADKSMQQYRNRSTEV